MAFTTPYTFTGSTTLDPAKLDSCFSAISSKLNAGLTEANFSSDTQFSNSFLTNSIYTFPISFSVSSVQYAAGTVNNFLATAGIADIGSTDTYTVLGYSWKCVDVGDQTGQFSLIWIENNPSALITTLASNITMVSDSGINDTVGTGGAILNTDITLSASKNRFLQLSMGATKGTGLLSNGADILNVNLYLKRKNGLRQ